MTCITAAETPGLSRSADFSCPFFAVCVLSSQHLKEGDVEKDDKRAKRKMTQEMLFGAK